MSEFIQPVVQQQWSAPSEFDARIRRLVEGGLAIESIEVPRNPADGVLVVKGRLLRPSHELFSRWQSTLRPEGYTPMLRPLPHGRADEVALHIIPGVPVITPTRSRINIILFALTVLSTLFVGSLYGGDLLNIRSAWDLLLPE